MQREDEASPLNRNNNSPPEEIRISLKKARISSYLLYAATQLIKEKRTHVIIKATGNAISRACIVAEVLKHRILGLSQINNLSSIEVTDQGNVKRFLTLLDIKLTLNPDENEKKSIGFQEALPKEEINEWGEVELDRLIERIKTRQPFRQYRGPGGSGGDVQRTGGFRGGFQGGYRGGNGNRGGYPGPFSGRRDFEEDRRPRRGSQGGYREGDRPSRTQQGGYQQGGYQGGFRGNNRGGSRGGNRGGNRGFGGNFN